MAMEPVLVNGIVGVLAAVTTYIGTAAQAKTRARHVLTRSSDNRMGALEERVAKVEVQLEGLERQAGDVATKLDNIDAKFNQAAKDFATMSKEVGVIAGYIKGSLHVRG